MTGMILFEKPGVCLRLGLPGDTGDRKLKFVAQPGTAHSFGLVLPKPVGKEIIPTPHNRSKTFPTLPTFPG
jgi:hypothetical protein